MKLCNQCNKSWPDEFNMCPVCGGELSLEQTQSTESVSMGDGNAINGGVTISKDMSNKDDHSISSSHNTANSHNKTTTINHKTIYNGTVAHIEREKTPEELLREGKLKYREYCKKVLADGILSREDRLWLEEQRNLLDLSADVADKILKEVKNNLHRPITMTIAQRIQLDNLKKAIENNMVDTIKNLIPQIQLIANKIQDEEVQYIYYMVIAALDPEKNIRLYNETVGIEDNYWLTFWTYVSYCTIGEDLYAEDVILELDKWSDCKSHEDIEIVEILGHLIKGEKELAYEIFIRSISGTHSPILSKLSDVISSILFYDSEDSRKIEILSHNKFYIEHFLKTFYQLEKDADRIYKEQKIAKKKAEEDAIIYAKKTIGESEEKLRLLSKERERNSAEYTHQKRELEDLSATLKSDKQKLESETKAFQVERERLEAEYKKKYAELKEAEQMQIALINKNNELSADLESKNRRIKEEQLEIANARKKVDDDLKFIEESSSLLTKEREKNTVEYTRQKRELEDLSTTLKADKQKLESETKAFQVERERFEAEYKKKYAELKEADQKQIALINKHNELSADLESKNRRIKEEQLEIANARKKVDDDLKFIEESSSLLTKEREKNTVEYTRQKRELEDLSTTLKADKQKLESEIKAFQVERERFDAEYERKYAELKAAEQKQAELQRQNQELSETLESAGKYLENEQSEIANTRRKIEEEKKKIEAATALLSKEREECKRYKSELDELEVSLKNKQERLEDEFKTNQKLLQETADLEKKKLILQQLCEDLEIKKCNLQNEMNELAKAQRYCPVCGTEKSPDAIFCRQCGHNFTK